MQFLGDGRPHGVAPTDSLKVSKHPKSYCQTKKYICRGGPVWPPVTLRLHFVYRVTNTQLNCNLNFSFFLPQNSPFVNPLRPFHQNFFKIRPKPLYIFQKVCYTVCSQGHGTADALGEVVRNRILPSFCAPPPSAPARAGNFFAHPKQSRSGSPLHYIILKTRRTTQA